MKTGVLLVLLGTGLVVGAEPMPTPTPPPGFAVSYSPDSDPTLSDVPSSNSSDDLATLKPRLKATMKVQVVEVGAENVKIRYPGESHVEVWKTNDIEWILYPSGRRQAFEVAAPLLGTKKYRECAAVTLWWTAGAAINNGVEPEKTVLVPDGWFPIGGSTLSGRNGAQPVMIICR